MFIGHYGLGLASKRIAPSVTLRQGLTVPEIPLCETRTYLKTSKLP